MTTPDWWQFTLLALAAWRVFHLLAFDDILDKPRNTLCGLPRNWKEGDIIPRTYRENLAEFITCPYCLGFWSAVAWWAAFQWSPHWSVLLATPWALSAAVVAVHKLTSDG
ncbi:MAG: DUF1360 domain-containing protein [Candidatus Krumholzibacteria bacterium]|nr:DUF1360 domain-containing protein [Candidatus Krumholzibacteria bacterium]